MKSLLLLHFIISFSLSGFSQNLDSILAANKNISDNYYSNDTKWEFNSSELYDTTNYANGNINLITKIPAAKSGMNIQQFQRIVEVETVYQYDQCGNLRNTTKIYTKANIQSCWDYLGGQYIIEDKYEQNVDCDEIWERAIIY